MNRGVHVELEMKNALNVVRQVSETSSENKVNNKKNNEKSATMDLHLNEEKILLNEKQKPRKKSSGKSQESSISLEMSDTIVAAHDNRK